MAHPADLPGRIADDERMRRNVMGDDRPGGNEAMTSQTMAAENGGVRTDRGAASDDRRSELVLALDIGARVVDVREDAGRAAEHVAAERHTLIDAHIVLDLAAIADPD